MTPENDTALLALLKGPPLSIFLAVSRTNGIRSDHLCVVTGWSRNATYAALRLLVAEGWVRRRHGRWGLTPAGRAAWIALLTGATIRLGPRHPVLDSGTSAAQPVPPSNESNPLTVPENGIINPSPTGSPSPPQ